jgi:DNA polymerase
LSLSPIEKSVSLRAALRQLRWILTALQGSGIGDFHRQQPILPVIPAPPKEGATEPHFRDPSGELAAIRNELGDCRRCRLHAGRSHLVFGEGSPHARLVFVGEGPGFDEDRLGRPFVGRAGKLLDKMIQAIQLKREEVYICNVVKCRPPDNRTPSTDEIEICSPFLFRQLEAIQPDVICVLGLCAAQTLLERAPSMGGVRGKLMKWRGIPLMCTYHPAYLLRNPVQKAAAWQDLIQVRRILTARKS